VLYKADVSIFASECIWTEIAYCVFQGYD